MHPAPPVRVTLGRSRAWLAFAAVGGGAAAASLTAWLLMRAQASAPGWGALAAGLLGAVAAWVWAWRGQAPGVLSWGGGCWQWAGRTGDLRVMIDLDRWMLLRLDVLPKGRRWVVASRRAAEGSWPALRAALYSRRPADPLSNAPPA